MGMFDSFYMDPAWGIDCPKCGTVIGELQTKDLECDLVVISIDPAGRTSVRHARDHLNDLANLYCNLTRSVEAYTSCDACDREMQRQNLDNRSMQEPWLDLTLNFERGRLVRVTAISWQMEGRIHYNKPRIHRPDIYPAALDPTHQRYEVDYMVTERVTRVVEARTQLEAEEMVKKEDRRCGCVEYSDIATCDYCLGDLGDASRPAAYTVDDGVIRCAECALKTDNDSSTPNDGAKGAE